MNCTYEKLSPTFSQELWELLDEADTLGIDPKVLSAFSPFTSAFFAIPAFVSVTPANRGRKRYIGW